MSLTNNRRFLLVRRPNGVPVAEDFRLETQPPPALADGQFLIRNQYASLDPAMRGWLDDAPSYLPPVKLGDPVRASTVGIVTESRAADYPVGAWVMGLHGIEDYSLAQAGPGESVIDPKALPSVTNYLSLTGAVGLTAYFGFLDVCEPKAGDTVLVTGAAGAVGSLVGQLAKLKGCRVIGVAGGPVKCARLLERYGFDAAIDYRGKDEAALAADIKRQAPDGLDIIFENVGGIILDAGLMNLRLHARVGLCGLISEYNSTSHVGARNLWRLIVTRSSIRGLLVADYWARFGEGAKAMATWAAEGKLVFDEHIDEGIENALPAFMRLFNGTNDGKMILSLKPE
jgi:NADPH-dependent curcumin reductase CurA